MCVCVLTMQSEFVIFCRCRYGVEREFVGGLTRNDNGIPWSIPVSRNSHELFSSSAQLCAKKMNKFLLFPINTCWSFQCGCALCIQMPTQIIALTLPFYSFLHARAPCVCISRQAIRDVYAFSKLLQFWISLILFLEGDENVFEEEIWVRNWNGGEP